MSVTTLASLTAIVLNWRTPELAKRAARALLADGLPPERLVVIDNGSGDGSAQHLRTAFARSRVLALPENGGFAAANNRGAAALPSRSAYLFVNSDAFVHAPGSLSALAKELEDPGVGAAVPRLLHADLTLQPSVYPLSSPLPELIRAAGLSRWVPERVAPGLSGRWSHGRTRDVQGAVGAVLLLRAAAFDELGGFDERRGMYAEDLDLFWRLRSAGWRTRFVAEAEFVHLGGASAVRRWNAASRAERVARAEAELLHRHLGPVRAGVTLGLMAAGAAGRALAQRAQGRPDQSAVHAAAARGYLSRDRAADGSDA